MANEKQKITKLTDKMILETIEEAIKDCYGIKSFISDINENTLKGTARSGVSIRKHTDHTFSVDIYVAMASDVKITESLREAQKKVRYVLLKEYPERFRNVNVFASEVVL